MREIPCAYIYDYMKQELINTIKKYKLLHHLSKLIYYRLFVPILYFKKLLSDPSYIKKNPFWYKKIKEIQLKKNIPLFLDRQLELKEFFKISNIFLLKYYLKNGFPNTRKFRKKLKLFFSNKTNEDSILKKTYEEASFHYASRTMLHREKYNFIIPYLNFIIENLKKPINKIKVLDYGCSTADIGLILAYLGAEVTLAELDDKKFEFTQWRFKKRGLKPKIIKIKDPAKLPKLIKSEYDLIITIEVFEHIRNPLKLLKNLTKALKLGGFLFDSIGKEFKREIGGDHLKEAIKIGQSEEYKKYYNDYYTNVFPRKNLETYLFKKIKLNEN